MKKILTQCMGIAVLSSIFVGTIYAANASPSATPMTTDTDKTKQIEDLKERLATKVAELRQMERRAIEGVVKTTSITSFTVETKTKDLKIELTDSLKVVQYLKGKRTVLKTDDISKNDPVVIFGDYDTSLDLMKAKVVFITGAIPLRINGIVTSSDEKDFSFTMVTADKTEYTVDFEKNTKSFEWTVDNKTTKSGFSKIQKGNYVTILGSINPKDDKRISATKIVTLNTEMITPTNTPVASVSATPNVTVKTTTKPTVKPTVKVSPTP